MAGLALLEAACFNLFQPGFARHLGCLQEQSLGEGLRFEKREFW